MKHIETILPEFCGYEAERIVREDGDATCSAALTDLLRRATGCEIPQADTLPESEVEELVPLCMSILRRHWTTPLTALGDGTDKCSLEDTFRQLILGSVDGYEALGIPSAKTSIADAVAALRDRHIDDGCVLTLDDGTTTSMPDGLSLAQLLCGTSHDGTDLASQVTELRDDNRGWVMTKALSGFPNLEKLELGCKENKVGIALNLDIVALKLDNLEVANNIIAYGIKGEDTMIFPRLRYSSGEANGNNNAVISMSECRILHLPQLEEYTRIGNNAWLKNMPMLEEIYMPKLSKLGSTQFGLWGNHIADCEKLWKVVYGAVKLTGMNTGYASLISGNCPNLIHLEFGNGSSCNIGLLGWSPSTALAERLPEFLSNFQTYIADRVADRTGNTALTLTLSAAVYEALQAQEGQTILATLANKNWNVAQA